ncbi:MAG: hypothetical protein D6723_16655 [Acidobacteria bacterium]|nr:MAG: hypothetical protein D6723_16655 [Acidobacteriota bacterium]
MMHLQQQFSRALGLPLTSLHLIKENAYCFIYQAHLEGQPVIVKKYKGADPHLAEMEARAIDFYHQIARHHQDLIDSRTIAFNRENNILCIQYVPGECFSRLLYRSIVDRRRRQRALRIMTILGEFLRDLYETTRQPGADTDAFIFEYFHYCSRRLETLPVLGPLFFPGIVADAERLSHAFRRAGVAPSFIHGDFVFKNIHVLGERVGLIDFANTNARSHVLNDVYNLRLALDNMLLPASFKAALLGHFFDGLGAHAFPEIAHRFYYEYHRRRWLMLKIRSRHPLDWLQAWRGLFGFARPFTPRLVFQS